MVRWMVCLTGVILATGALADDWYTWRGPNGNGISSESGWNPVGASIAWEKELGEGYSSVSVKDGRLYTMGNKEGKDVIYCLNAGTGEEIWKTKHE